MMCLRKLCSSSRAINCNHRTVYWQWYFFFSYTCLQVTLYMIYSMCSREEKITQNILNDTINTCLKDLMCEKCVFFIFFILYIIVQFFFCIYLFGVFFVVSMYYTTYLSINFLFDFERKTERNKCAKKLNKYL